MLRRLAVLDLAAFASQCTESLDGRADAFGHGLALVAPVARDAGVAHLVVSTEADARVAEQAGFDRGTIGIDREGGGADTAAYGLDGSGHPVLSVIGEVVALKRIPAGAGVSYGYTYRPDSATTLALIGLGYADGVPRLGSNRARVAVAGTSYPLVGRIAMDQLVLDVGDDTVELGADAVVFGDPRRGEPSAREWADWTGRTPLALTAGIAARVTRRAR